MLMRGPYTWLLLAEECCCGMCLRMYWDLQHERDTWRENGIAPPMPGTDAEKYWIEVDKAVPYTKVCSLVCKAH